MTTTQVKTILEAQGFPTKKNVVTYHFAVKSPNDDGGFYSTVKFQHDRYGVSQATFDSAPHAAIGEKMVLLDEVKGDSSLHSLPVVKLGSIKRSAALDALPPGRAHRFTVYLQFTPHHGPPRNAGISMGIKRD